MGKVKEIKVTRYIDTFDKSGFRKAYVSLTENGVDANLLNQLYQKLGLLEEDRTIDKLEDRLNNKTGFQNALMSADSLGVKKDYVLILELSKNIDLKNYEEDGSVKKEVFNALQDSFTKFYTAKESEYQEKILVVVGHLNSIEKNDALAIHYNTLKREFQYRKQIARTNKQFANRI